MAFLFEGFIRCLPLVVLIKGNIFLVPTPARGKKSESKIYFGRAMKPVNSLPSKEAGIPLRAKEREKVLFIFGSQ